MNQTSSFKVTNRLLRNLEVVYNNSENPPVELILQKNLSTFKYEWKISVPSNNNATDLKGSKFSKRQSIKFLDE